MTWLALIAVVLGLIVGAATYKPQAPTATTSSDTYDPPDGFPGGN